MEIDLNKLERILPMVRKPGRYVGGEYNNILKDWETTSVRVCLAFPDTYAIGMSHHGLQVLYALMNQRPQWACERAFAPWADMEQVLREQGIPLYSLETFTPLDRFDVLGFTLQHDLCYTNVLTMLELGGVPEGGRPSRCQLCQILPAIRHTNPAPGSDCHLGQRVLHQVPVSPGRF